MSLVRRSTLSIGGSILLASSMLLGVPDAGGAQEAWPPPAPASLFAPDPEKPLDYREEEVPSPFSSVRMFRVSFASSPEGRATGLLAVPERPGGLSGFLGRVLGRSGRHPAVVVMHGMPGSARGAMEAWGISFAQRGAVVISIDAPWARRGGGLVYTPQDSVEQVQLIRDLRRAVDVLVARDDVDPDRIAYSGISYGGGIGALLVGVEPRLRTAILRVGGAGIVSRVTDAAGQPVEGLAEQTPERQDRWLAAMRPIEPRRFLHGAEGTPVLYMSGRGDPFVSEDDVETLLREAPEPRTVRWYDGGHALTMQADLDMLAWMQEHIGLRTEVAEEPIPPAAQPAESVRDSARVYARWFAAGDADSLWAASHPRLKERYPEMHEEIRDAMERFGADVSGALRPVAERFVWRNDQLQYWQTLEVTETGRQVVLRLVLLSSGTGGIRGWGWSHPERVPAVDSAGPVVWPIG